MRETTYTIICMKQRKVGDSTNRLIMFTITIIVVLFVSAVSYVFHRDGNIFSKNNTKQSVASVQNTQNIDEKINLKKDSDNDGLADWEEVLWNTDPSNPDSDGDGIKDGEDILSDNSQNDSNTKSLAFDVNTSAKYETSHKQLTTTDIFSRDALSDVMLSVQTGKYISKEQILKNAVSAVKPLIGSKQYTEKDLNIVPATKANRFTYAKTLKMEIIKMLKGSKNEYVGLSDIAKGDKKKGIAELKKTVSNYNIHIDKLSNIPVPDDAIGVHLSFINAISKYVYNLEGISLLYTDPVRTAASLQNFLDSKDNLGTANKQVIIYMNKLKDKNATDQK